MTHSYEKTRVWRIWYGMLERCRRPTNTVFKFYGGRGIKVCERWQVFDNFLADMGEPPLGMTLEREKTDGDYEPSNCRWATMKEQQRNRRNTHWLTFDGRTQAMSAWAEEAGVPYKTLWMRVVKYGWTVERALQP